MREIWSLGHAARGGPVDFIHAGYPCSVWLLYPGPNPSMPGPDRSWTESVADALSENYGQHSQGYCNQAGQCANPTQLCPEIRVHLQRLGGRAWSGRPPPGRSSCGGSRLLGLCGLRGSGRGYFGSHTSRSGLSADFLYLRGRGRRRGRCSSGTPASSPPPTTQLCLARCCASTLARHRDLLLLGLQSL